jgi:hypothetical protein
MRRLPAERVPEGRTLVTKDAVEVTAEVEAEVRDAVEAEVAAGTEAEARA